MVCVFSILRFLSPPAQISRGEKIFYEGGRAVLRHSAQTFLPGEGSQGFLRPRTRPARAPKRSADHRRQRARKAFCFCRISANVFRLWQE